MNKILVIRAVSAYYPSRRRILKLNFKDKKVIEYE
jgi:hypothetical protein